MPRTIKDTKLDTPAARAKLPSRRDPYWRSIDRAAALGYRRGKSGGFWVARWRSPESRYRFTSLGVANDRRDADGKEVLDFYQAQEKAREWFAEQPWAKSAATDQVEEKRDRKGPYTVADAIGDYLIYYEAHRKPSGLEFTRYVTNAFILPKLGGREIAELTAREIRAWHEGIAAAPARLRSARGAATRHRAAASDSDRKRARRSSANRLLTVLKAALNRAYEDGHAQSDDAWRRVKAFKDVDQARVRYLSNDECTRLVNACAPDLRSLVQAALLTGVRYGELAAMQCDDFEADSGTVLVREAKSGKPRHAVLSDEGVLLFESLTAGRPADAPMFVKADNTPWGRWHQRRPLAQASAAASIDPPVTFHALRHTHASQLAMRGVSLQVIAHQLGHADTRICEKHYAHLAPSYVADVIRENMPKLGIVTSAKVKRLRPKRA